MTLLSVDRDAGSGDAAPGVTLRFAPQCACQVLPRDLDGREWVALAGGEMVIAGHDATLVAVTYRVVASCPICSRRWVLLGSW